MKNAHNWLNSTTSTPALLFLVDPVHGLPGEGLRGNAGQGFKGEKGMMIIIRFSMLSPEKQCSTECIQVSK